jgi:hypothetical protein
VPSSAHPPKSSPAPLHLDLLPSLEVDGQIVCLQNRSVALCCLLFFQRFFIVFCGLRALSLARPASRTSLFRHPYPHLPPQILNTTAEASRQTSAVCRILVDIEQVIAQAGRLSRPFLIFRGETIPDTQPLFLTWLWVAAWSSPHQRFSHYGHLAIDNSIARMLTS